MITGISDHVTPHCISNDCQCQAAVITSFSVAKLNYTVQLVESLDRTEARAAQDRLIQAHSVDVATAVAGALLAIVYECLQHILSRLVPLALVNSRSYSAASCCS